MDKRTDNEFLSRKMSYETANRIVQRLFHELCVELAKYSQAPGSRQGLPQDRSRYLLWWLPRRAVNWMTEELKERLITTLKSIPELVKERFIRSTILELQRKNRKYRISHS